VNKRIKRLTRLKIDEVSAVTAAANPGARVAIMKRDGGKKRRVAGFDAAGQFVDRDGVPEWRWKRGVVANLDDGDSLAKALAEIETNRAFVKAAAPLMGDTMQTQEVDVVKAMSSRITEIRKADPSIRSDNHAMLRLSESRNLADQALWRGWKQGVVLASTVQKAIDPEKAVRKMTKRVDQLMQSDPTIRSRESAIAKIATSPLQANRKLWSRYKASGMAIDNSRPLPIGKQTSSESAFEALVAAIRASNPRLSDAQAREWARRTQQHAPPSVGRLVGYRL
jgi:hypothetical protein